METTVIKYKANFDLDIRRFSFSHKPTYQEFQRKLNEIYQLGDESLSSIHITYQDDSNDNISISNALDFDESIHFYHDTKQTILRLFITKKDTTSHNNSKHQQHQQHHQQQQQQHKHKNVGDLESLFVSLLSNQMIQQMIPQVINNLANNPTLMTSIIQTAGNTLRNQNNLLNNTTSNSKSSPNTFHTQSTDQLVLGLEKMKLTSTNSIPNSPSQVIESTNITTISNNNNNNTTIGNGNHLKKSGSLESCNNMTTSTSSSNSTSDITKSFEEIDSIPTNTTTSSPTPTNVLSNEKEKKSNPPNLLSQVPKIFQNIHFPFSSNSTSTSTSLSINSQESTKSDKKSEDPTTETVINTTPTSSSSSSSSLPTQHVDYIPTQIYPINQPMPYSSPNFSYHLPQSIQSNSPVNVSQSPSALRMNPQVLPYQPPTVSNQPVILQKPTAPTQLLPPQPPQQKPLPQIPIQQPQQQSQQQLSYDERVKFIQDALQVTQDKAKELMEKYKGNIEEIFQEQQ
ncbi:hypothetical protein DLAC_03038 [Tieghemostelium lacteum]|uniref:PB1 domain-containing protein n=1 Tax=Tieghemostelium lacteum TaxID=361077 RepID=A0A152A3X1_TIELA|nr:hypothetical protein DLAC_03038 [Tieghemostelium lacteum]|eukprot:KYR00973.1 hypothetical protein DLAC_03038 [Tieghemostelium lacteum]